MQQKVLIIEDSSTSLALLKKLVERAGLKPVVATTLAEARHIFLHSDPEHYLCAIVDYHLPDAPNGEAIDYAIDSFIPTIVSTGKLDADTRNRVLAKDVVDYIPKENAQVFDYLMRLLSRLEKNKGIEVIVADPKRQNRTAMAALLRRHNFITLECATTEDVETLLGKHPNVKLLLIDSEIKGELATQFVAHLRKTYSKETLAILGLSADENNLLSARFIKSGANDFVKKPFCHEELLCRITLNIDLIEKVETIRRTANTDYLTGLPNRRHFFYTVDQYQQAPLSHQSVALIDLDHFKRINDTYGHDAGDAVLKAVARRIASHCADLVVSRFGGEEFCVYLPDLPSEAAIERIEALRQHIASKPVNFKDQMLPVTASIGLTTASSTNVHEMLTRADKLLYQAKTGGRNQVAHD
ncbi:MAG TPA: diguanylate cyclase response regulator [Alteromonas sp.]|nr:diguanylate cyclase response regulator [Alteromonadaceae bacterium]MAX43177.1 diguanylate cyclase response regulator [Alteromonadaceae bacterium]HBY38539.1 diguanylate cyclase response regulator [Alteromonas sp.]|tara:strand:+ start:25605 stop:26843 length:1239 start_codon:yes stop_codon:yes gene_type:complete